MSKIFGEEHFIEEDMVSLMRSEIDNKIDKMVFDKMQQTIYLQLPEIKINEDKLRKWVLLCMKLENIEHSDLIDIATKKKFADLKQQLADKEVKIEVLERDIDNLYRTLEEVNEEFAEKDKEIEELKADKNKIICHIGYDNLKFLMETNDWKICDNTQFDNFVKQLRHQVCEEIKGKAFRDCIGLNKEGKNFYHYVISPEILDQIEKGESK